MTLTLLMKELQAKLGLVLCGWWDVIIDWMAIVKFSRNHKCVGVICGHIQVVRVISRLMQKLQLVSEFMKLDCSDGKSKNPQHYTKGNGQNLLRPTEPCSLRCMH